MPLAAAPYRASGFVLWPNWDVERNLKKRRKYGDVAPVVDCAMTIQPNLIAPQRTAGVVLLQVGTAFVTPTEGQLYVPIDGAVTVPTGFPDVP
jgi:hypothetical protein